MEIRATALERTNLHSRLDVVVVAEATGFPERLTEHQRQALRALAERSGTEIGEFRDLLADPARGLSLLAVALLRAAGADAARLAPGATEPTTGAAAFECADAATGRAALQAAVRLLGRTDSESRPDDALREALDMLESRVRGRLSHFAVRAARRLGIPWRLVTDNAEPLVALGQGLHGRVFWKHMTADTSHAGVTFTTDKRLANAVLKRSGLPVPRQAAAADLRSALRAARRFGWPVVAKPARTDFGIGITTGIGGEDDLARAFAEAAGHGPVVIEEQIPGDHHRLLVFRGEFLSAVRQTPAQVIGDGAHSVEALISITNETRSERLSDAFKRITLDEAALQVIAGQGLSLSEVPASGRVVRIRNHSNASVGGTRETVTDAVHPANARLAEMAASVFALDLAGIDMMSRDIGRPAHENGAAIIEVNATPGLFMGDDRLWIEERIVGGFFDDRLGRIPTVACLDDGLGLDRLVADLLALKGMAVATAGPDGVRMGADRVSGPGASLPIRSAMALASPSAEAAVLSIGPDELAAQGLGIDRVSVAVGSQLPVPRGPEALIALDRASDATVLSARQLEAFARARSGEGPVWCVLDEDGAPRALGEVGVVSRIDRSTVRIVGSGGDVADVAVPAPGDRRDPAPWAAAVLLCLGVEPPRISALFDGSTRFGAIGPARD